MRKLDFIRKEVNKLTKVVNGDQDKLGDLIRQLQLPSTFYRKNDVMNEPLLACAIYSGYKGSIIGVSVGHPFIDPDEDEVWYWYEEFKFGKIYDGFIQRDIVQNSI